MGQEDILRQQYLSLAQMPPKGKIYTTFSQ